MSRARTAEELRTDFLDNCRAIVRHWTNDGQLIGTDRVEGVVFSILSLIDGCSGDWPAMDLVLRPHPDDKLYHMDQDEDWIEDGTVINEGVMLHELFYPKRAR